jgi:S1-C subfamily serine protease
MKPILRWWTLLLVAAILFVGGMIWVRLQPPAADRNNPLLQARESIAERFGMEVATAAGPEGGLLVEAVTPGEPAERVGIQVGDRIVACGDRSVWHVHQMVEVIDEQVSRGGVVAMLIERDGAYRLQTFGHRRHAPPRGTGGQS